MNVKLSRPITFNFVTLVSRQMKVIFSIKMSDDAKVHYYTGFGNCDLLRSTFEFVMKKFADGKKRSYCWRSFIIVLLKLRFILGLQDIAFRLNVSLAQSHVYFMRLRHHVN